MLATHHLNQRTPLLEFAEGCRMNPKTLSPGVNEAFSFPPYTSLAGGKRHSLDITDASSRHTDRYRIIPAL